MYPFKLLNKKKYILCFLNAFLENICIYIMPVILSIFLSIPFTIEKFKILIILTIVIKSLEILFNVIWNTKVMTFLELSKKDLLISYFNRICNMEISNTDTIHTGFIKKQIDDITDESVQFFDEIMMTVNGFVVAISIFLIQVWFQSIIMFVICTIFIGLIVLYNFVITKKNILIQEDYNTKNASYNSVYVDFLNNIKTIKFFNVSKYANEKFTNSKKILKKPLKKANFFNMMRSDGVHLLVYIMYSFLLVSLYLKMKNGEDIFSLLVFYTSMFAGLNVELKGMAKLFTTYNKVKSANNLIEANIKEQNIKEIVDDWNNIKLQNIKFNYDSEMLLNIKIPKFELNKYDKVGITGKSGQGKTTFLSIFSRHYEIEKEKYLIDGISTDKVPNIVYISQDVDMLDLSIKDNLSLGRNISDTLLTQYLSDAGLMEWINNLDNKLETIVGEKGFKMSSGQKQRLNIIRGILLDRDIYIFDEPTSNLDIETEERICFMIKKYLSTKTCIISTHREKIINICNKRYNFENRTMYEKQLINKNTEM